MQNGSLNFPKVQISHETAEGSTTENISEIFKYKRGLKKNPVLEKQAIHPNWKRRTMEVKKRYINDYPPGALC